MKATLLKIPTEIFYIMLAEESSVTLAKLRVSCIFFNNVLELLYQQKKKEESIRMLQACVYTSKLFIQQQQRQLTKEDEVTMYRSYDKVELCFGDVIIGHAKFIKFNISSSHWCGYCKVPAACYMDYLAYEYNLSDNRWKTFKETIGKDVPEITWYSEENWLGWDHLHFKDSNNYTNLAGVFQEINLVWGLTKLFWK